MTDSMASSSQPIISATVQLSNKVTVRDTKKRTSALFFFFLVEGHNLIPHSWGCLGPEGKRKGLRVRLQAMLTNILLSSSWPRIQLG